MSDLSALSLPRFAVIFRTHFWDKFAQRQLDRLLARVVGGDVFVLVDETNGRVEGIGHDKIVRMTEQDVLGMGYPRAGIGNMLWFNGDYPLYYFFKAQPGYDYYVLAEYDVVLNVDVDPLVRRVAFDKVDFVGLTKGEPIGEWPWLETCRGVYAMGDIHYQLICMSVYSHRAMAALAERRLELAHQLAAEEISTWPFCEGFIATELRRNNFLVRELADYVNTDAYASWPPFVESDLPIMADRPLIHPVLDQERYVGSMLKFKVGLLGYFNINSLFHRKLRRLPPAQYLTALTNSFAQKAIRNVRAGRVLSK